MWRIGTLLLIVLILGAAPVWAAEEEQPKEPAQEPAKEGGEAKEGAEGKEAGEGEAKKEEAAPEVPKILTEDQQKVAAIHADLLAGNVDKALEAVKEFLRDTKDEEAKTDAYLVLAEATRKKGDWRNASNAYQRVRDRHEKGSDKYLKYDAISDVLKASPTGVYNVQGQPKKMDPDGKTLADDAVLAESVGRMMVAKLEKLKIRVLALKRARSPQDVVKQFDPIAGECRQAIIVASDVDMARGYEAASTAGERMQQLASQVVTSLRGKLQKYSPKMDAPWSFTNVEKKAIGDYQMFCRELAVNEKNFQEQVAKVSGGEWAEGGRIRKESESRRASYERLAEEFVVPAYTVDIITH